MPRSPPGPPFLTCIFPAGETRRLGNPVSLPFIASPPTLLSGTAALVLGDEITQRTEIQRQCNAFLGVLLMRLA